MKITKDYLKQIIKEAIKEQEESAAEYYRNQPKPFDAFFRPGSAKKTSGASKKEQFIQAYKAYAEHLLDQKMREAVNDYQAALNNQAEKPRFQQRHVPDVDVNEIENNVIDKLFKMMSGYVRDYKTEELRDKLKDELKGSKK